ncbi:cyclic nucleotide-binding domain-containing protein [Mariprofundus ferrinatatus]|nr:cyclic nucleotide-binding domain-containing protein [Mariprofundus ferrinatatus]
MIEMTGAIPLFDDIDGSQIRAIAARMKTAHLAEKQPLFSEGEESDFMCFIVSGTVDVYKRAQTGNLIAVSSLSRGRSIGEMALMDSYPRSATVIARTPCTLLMITRENFDKILADHPRAGIAFMKALSQGLSLQLRRTSGQLADAYESSGSGAILPDPKEMTALSVANKTTKLIDHIINRKPTDWTPLIRRFI